MCVNDSSNVALDNAAAGIDPAISNRKSNTLTTTPPSHTALSNFTNFVDNSRSSMVTLYYVISVYRFGKEACWLCFRLLNVSAHIIDEATPGPPPAKPTLPSLPNPPSLSPIRRRGKVGVAGKDDSSSPQGTPAKEKGTARTPSKGSALVALVLFTRLLVLPQQHWLHVTCRGCEGSSVRYL